MFCVRLYRFFSVSLILIVLQFSIVTFVLLFKFQHMCVRFFFQSFFIVINCYYCVQSFFYLPFIFLFNSSYCIVHNSNRNLCTVYVTSWRILALYIYLKIYILYYLKQKKNRTYSFFALNFICSTLYTWDIAKWIITWKAIEAFTHIMYCVMVYNRMKNQGQRISYTNWYNTVRTPFECSTMGCFFRFYPFFSQFSLQNVEKRLHFENITKRICMQWKNDAIICQ